MQAWAGIAERAAALVAHIVALFIHVMTSREGPSVATIAAIASAALVAAFLLQRRGAVAKELIQHKDETPPTKKSTTKDSGQARQRRMTLEESLQKDSDLTVKPIGTVRSIYRLCVGTPRQGLLAPNARGRLELDSSVVSQDAVLELDGFSHVWVIFVFHLNTIAKNQQIPSKIAPPSLGGGKKVGVLATRSPHRVNPIGMTLCKLVSITTRLATKAQQPSSPKTILNVSGLDLVDGTPILDIKPYVPHYDSVPFDQVRLPSWVSGGLATRRQVDIQPTALEELELILSQQPNALDFYGSHVGDSSIDETMKSITNCIVEVLSIDVRSVWQTNKARANKFQAERAGRVQDVMSDGIVVAQSENTNSGQCCTQQLDNLLVCYTVQAPEQHARNTSQGSGAEDVVLVNSIQLLTTTDTPKSNTCVEDVVREEATFNNVACSPVNWNAKNGDNQQRNENIATTVVSRSMTTAPPTDADYKSLKSYWGEAAARNTPTGLLPKENDFQRQQKCFVFSDKPITPVRPQKANTNSLSNSEVAVVEFVSSDETKMTPPPRAKKSVPPTFVDDEVPHVVSPLPVVESNEQETAADRDMVDEKTEKDVERLA